MDSSDKRVAFGDPLAGCSFDLPYKSLTAQTRPRISTDSSQAVPVPLIRYAAVRRALPSPNVHGARKLCKMLFAVAQTIRRSVSLLLAPRSDGLAQGSRERDQQRDIGNGAELFVRRLADDASERTSSESIASPTLRHARHARLRIVVSQSSRVPLLERIANDRF